MNAGLIDRDRLHIQLQGRDEFAVLAQYVLKISDCSITELDSNLTLGILLSHSLTLIKIFFLTKVPDSALGA
jgi:hypothetical protein